MPLFSKKNKRIRRSAIKNKRMNKKQTKRNRRRPNLGMGRGEDPMNLKGKKICGDRFDLYFNDVFSSSNYYVYSLCRDRELNDCQETLAKLYPITPWHTSSVIAKEIEYITRASNLGVTPTLIGVEQCEYNGSDYIIIIMEKYGNGSLTDLLSNGYYEDHKEEINRQLKHILDELYDSDISHGDLHSENFLYKMKDDGEIELKIIDFDLAEPLGSNKRDYVIDDVRHMTHKKKYGINVE